jgi:LysR family transcriptional regulator, transcriptional activator of nhaA
MDWLNYHHLLYFWVVAREGGLTAAGKVLRLSHPTLSAQVRALEAQLGEKLLVRAGRRLELTEMGRGVYRYAQDICALVQELQDVVKGRATGQPLRLEVGVVDVVPKLVVRRLLQPALVGHPAPRPVFHEGTYEQLLARLGKHELDLVLADSPVPSGSAVRAFNHPLGETGVTFFAAPAVAASLGKGFPRLLDGAPVLLPLEHLALRRALDAWFERHQLAPRVVAEFEDSALLKVFGGDGMGVFPAPTVIEAQVARQYGVQVLGRTDEVKERYYGVTVERRLKHPAVVAITGAARAAGRAS